MKPKGWLQVKLWGAICSNRKHKRWYKDAMAYIRRLPHKQRRQADLREMREYLYPGSGMTLIERLVARTLGASEVEAGLNETLVPFEASGAKIMDVARKWVAANPDLGKRIYRAIALTGGVTQVEGQPTTFYVEGGDDVYQVRINPSTRHSTCTCPDTQTRGAHCKHRLAVALIFAARGNRLA